MLAAPFGSDPSQHWEHTTIYTQQTQPPPETARPEAVYPSTPVHKEHRGPQASPVSSDTFMCHCLPPYGHHHLSSTYGAEV